MDTLLVGVEAGVEDLVEDGRVDEVVGLLLVQVPKVELQPVPQCLKSGKLLAKPQN